jgi:hypothetical protein
VKANSTVVLGSDAFEFDEEGDIVAHRCNAPEVRFEHIESATRREDGFWIVKTLDQDGQHSTNIEGPEYEAAVWGFYREAQALRARAQR